MILIANIFTEVIFYKNSSLNEIKWPKVEQMKRDKVQMSSFDDNTWFNLYIFL